MHHCEGYWPYPQWPGSVAPGGYYYVVQWPGYAHQPGSVDDSDCVRVPCEISADPTVTTQELVVGGERDVTLILEYLPADGAVAPEVTVETKGTGGTATFNETGITAGFHVKNDFPPASPGTKLRLTVKECFARLRWCERLKY